jgi:hypothetical protein
MRFQNINILAKVFVVSIHLKKFGIVYFFLCFYNLQLLPVHGIMDNMCFYFLDILGILAILFEIGIEDYEFLIPIEEHFVVLGIFFLVDFVDLEKIKSKNILIG